MTMDEKVLCFAGAAFRRALERAGCRKPQSTAVFPFQIGSRAASLHHEGSDYDLAVKLSDAEYQLRGLDLLGLFAQEVRNGAGSKVSCVHVEWENSTAKFRCMGCDVSLLVCSDLHFFSAVTSTMIQRDLFSERPAARELFVEFMAMLRSHGVGNVRGRVGDKLKSAPAALMFSCFYTEGDDLEAICLKLSHFDFQTQRLEYIDRRVQQQKRTMFDYSEPVVITLDGRNSASRVSWPVYAKFLHTMATVVKVQSPVAGIDAFHLLLQPNVLGQRLSLVRLRYDDIGGVHVFDGSSVSDIVILVLSGAGNNTDQRFPFQYRAKIVVTTSIEWDADATALAPLFIALKNFIASTFQGCRIYLVCISRGVSACLSLASVYPSYVWGQFSGIVFVAGALVERDDGNHECLNQLVSQMPERAISLSVLSKTDSTTKWRGQKSWSLSKKNEYLLYGNLHERLPAAVFSATLAEADLSHSELSGRIGYYTECVVNGCAVHAVPQLSAPVCACAWYKVLVESYLAAPPEPGEDVVHARSLPVNTALGNPALAPAVCARSADARGLVRARFCSANESIRDHREHGASDITRCAKGQCIYPPACLELTVQPIHSSSGADAIRVLCSFREHVNSMVLVSGETSSYKSTELRHEIMFFKRTRKKTMHFCGAGA